MTQRIPALYMRGGTSKGLFFRAQDLPRDPRDRDALLLRAMGSPDPYGTQIDGMGGATSSTSKVMLLSRSLRPDHDVDYLFGAVSIREALIDWSGNCGNLSAAVGPCALEMGLLQAPPGNLATVRMWQANIGRTVVATVPLAHGQFQDRGDFMLDGVAFTGARIGLEFLDPGAGEEGKEGGEGGSGALFPTGRPLDMMEVPGLAPFEATLINAGNPTVMIDAGVLGLQGTELQPAVNTRAELLDLAERIRAAAAVRMGLASDAASATRHRPATPKLAFFAPAASYVASSGQEVDAGRVDLTARIFSMGKLHHAMTGTGGVAIASAAAVPGTVVQRLVARSSRPRQAGEVSFGHASGVTEVRAEASCTDRAWSIRRVSLSRSARILMDGMVRVP